MMLRSRARVELTDLAQALLTTGFGHLEVELLRDASAPALHNAASPCRRAAKRGGQRVSIGLRGFLERHALSRPDEARFDEARFDEAPPACRRCSWRAVAVRDPGLDPAHPLVNLSAASPVQAEALLAELESALDEEHLTYRDLTDLWARTMTLLELSSTLGFRAAASQSHVAELLATTFARECRTDVSAALTRLAPHAPQDGFVLADLTALDRSAVYAGLSFPGVPSLLFAAFQAGALENSLVTLIPRALHELVTRLDLTAPEHEALLLTEPPEDAVLEALGVLHDPYSSGQCGTIEGALEVARAL
jgi:hypothetical protein